MSENRILPETFGVSGIEDATYLWSLFNECTDDDLIQIVHIFFNQIDRMEAFFYYMMSKRCIVDHILPITQRYLSTLRPIGTISHIIDGWEDFFLNSSYTLGNTSPIEIEMYRQRVIGALSFILQHLGESRLSRYYQCRLLDYFSILYRQDISREGEGEREGESEDDDDDEEDDDENDDIDDENDVDDVEEDDDEDIEEDDDDEGEGEDRREGE